MNVLTEDTEGVITVAFPKNGLPNAHDASHKPTGHVYESIVSSDSADIHAGDIGESKCGAECSQKHTYRRIEGKKVRATLGNAYNDDFVDKFFGKEQPKDETKCFERCTKEGGNDER